MREFIGVKSALNFNDNFLKREALIFSRIAVPLADLIDIRIWGEDVINEFESLIAFGIAFTPSFKINKDLFTSNEEYRTNIFQISGLVDEASRLVKEDESSNKYKEGRTRVSTVEMVARHVKTTQALIQSYRMYSLSGNYYSRAVSMQLRHEEGLDAIPVLSDITDAAGGNLNRSEVVNIVLRNLPIPSDSVSWEQIIEYRSDPDSYSKFLDLRNWMSEIARGELSATEIEEKLEYLVSQYRRHLQLHKMKTNAGTLETVIVSGAEILEDLVHLKFSKAAKALFSFKHRQIALIEGELTSKGSEVAYIVKAKEMLS